jgi:hypothetical protein
VPIPTEPIGSIPRPPELLSAIREHSEGRKSDDALYAAQNVALRDTIERFERIGSISSDGEQSKPSFATYLLTGLKNLAPDGVVIPFADGHTRQLPRLTAGPFRFGTHAVAYLKAAQQYTRLPRALYQSCLCLMNASTLVFLTIGIPSVVQRIIPPSRVFDGFLESVPRRCDCDRFFAKRLLHIHGNAFRATVLVAFRSQRLRPLGPTNRQVLWHSSQGRLMADTAGAARKAQHNRSSTACNGDL